jgi:transposase
MTMTRTLQNSATLYVAFELSAKKWKLAFTCELGARPRIRNVEGGDFAAVRQEIEAAKRHLGVANAKVVSCYEAGRDGFHLHRWLSREGVDNLVVDPASVEVERRRRKRKTDRIDVIKLLNRLVRHAWGEKVWSVVNVPSEQAEDERRVHRERERLIKERTQHLTRIKALLATRGLRPDKLTESALEQLRDWAGAALPEHLRRELTRELARLHLLTTQIRDVEREFTNLLNQDTPAAQATKALKRVKSVGMVAAQVLAYEFFGWRQFANRRQVGALAGMTGTPFTSGQLDHEQGISKAGNRRVRSIMTEVAWTWLRYQRTSALSRWYQDKYAGGNKRQRRTGIVALARKLLVALWRFVDQDVVPEGAILRAA